MALVKSKAKTSPKKPGRLFAGTSGYAFDAWKGFFYPDDLKVKARLPYYAERLGSVEINYTFRHQPTSATMAAWRNATPPGFRFSLKAHQWVTHVKRLQDLEAAHVFVNRALELGDRLGPLLFQCPPNMKLDLPRLEAFLAGLPKGPRYAFEFRDPAWAAAKQTLLRARAALVVSDTDEEPLGDGELDRGRFVYLRLRKTSYSTAELGSWATRVRAALDAGTEVYCYFKHEEEGLGPKLALALIGECERMALTPR